MQAEEVRRKSEELEADADQVTRDTERAKRDEHNARKTAEFQVEPRRESRRREMHEGFVHP